MRRCRFIAGILSMLVLTGCWNSLELTDRLFVMAVALDDGGDGKIKMTVQMYKPMMESSGSKIKSHKDSYINVTVVNSSLVDAIRDLITYVGRKAQWSHMRSILIGEQLARKDIKSIMDFFYRDTEPRLSTELMVTKGSAASYLEIAPFIESTVAQQLRETQRSGHRFASMTVDSTLLTFGMETKSESGVAAVPYVSRSEYDPENPTVSGVVFLKEGRMEMLVSPLETEYLLMLINRFKYGVIRLPCEHNEGSEAIYINNLQTKMKPLIRGNELEVELKTYISGAIAELKCTRIQKEEDELKLVRRFEKEITSSMDELLTKLQQNKMDALGIGNQIYRREPSIWMRWKKDWPQRFSKANINVNVRISISNHGIAAPRPVLSKDK